MGCSDGFKDANFATKISFFLMIFALGSNWLAFTTSSWIETSTYHMGLWRRCNINVTTDSGCSILDGVADVSFGVAQAFACLGFMSLNIACIVQLLFMFYGKFKQNSEAAVASGVLFVISTITWVISVAVFGGKKTGDADYFNYSYGLAVVACGLALLCGLLMCIGSRGIIRNLPS